MLCAMANDRIGEWLESVLWQFLPKFARQGNLADVKIAVGFSEHLTDKVFVHRRFTAMGVEMTSSEFDGLSQHHAKGDILDIEFMGDLQCLTDIVAIFYKSL